MFKYIYSFFGYKDEPINQNTQLLNNNTTPVNYTQSNNNTTYNNTNKYNCTYCFNSFNTMDEKQDHLLICKQKPKPISIIECNRCGRKDHIEDNCFEIKHIYGYYLRKQ